jgi:hypothetical protein
MERQNFLKDKLQALAHLRKRLDQLLYYAEEEDLLIKEDKANGWNTLEIMEHINLVNAHYLNQMQNTTPPQAEVLAKPRFGILAKYMLQNFSTNHKGFKKGLKLKSPASVDPLKRQAKGFKPVSNVVFRQIVQDLDALERYLQESETKAWEKINIKTLVPWLKIHGLEAITVMLEHTALHLSQAERLKN